MLFSPPSSPSLPLPVARLARERERGEYKKRIKGGKKEKEEKKEEREGSRYLRLATVEPTTVQRGAETPRAGTKRGAGRETDRDEIKRRGRGEELREGEGEEEKEREREGDLYAVAIKPVSQVCLEARP